MGALWSNSITGQPASARAGLGLQIVNSSRYYLHYCSSVVLNGHVARPHRFQDLDPSCDRGCMAVVNRKSCSLRNTDGLALWKIGHTDWHLLLGWHLPSWYPAAANQASVRITVGAVLGNDSLSARWLHDQLRSSYHSLPYFFHTLHSSGTQTVQSAFYTDSNFHIAVEFTRGDKQLARVELSEVPEKLLSEPLLHVAPVKVSLMIYKRMVRPSPIGRHLCPGAKKCHLYECLQPGDLLPDSEGCAWAVIADFRGTNVHSHCYKYDLSSCPDEEVVWLCQPQLSAHPYYPSPGYYIIDAKVLPESRWELLRCHGSNQDLQLFQLGCQRFTLPELMHCCHEQVSLNHLIHRKNRHVDSKAWTMQLAQLLGLLKDNALLWSDSSQSLLSRAAATPGGILTATL